LANCHAYIDECADIARLAGLHDVVQRFHGFFDRRAVVPAMDLIQIDVIRPETPQAVVDFRHDRLARQTCAVLTRMHAAMDLGSQHDFVALRKVLQRAADDFLAGAV
jgi:hypothetical protein